jgi:hypothetical protein
VLNQFAVEILKIIIRLLSSMVKNKQPEIDCHIFYTTIDCYIFYTTIDCGTFFLAPVFSDYKSTKQARSLLISIKTPLKDRLRLFWRPCEVEALPRLLFRSEVVEPDSFTRFRSVSPKALGYTISQTISYRLSTSNFRFAFAHSTIGGVGCKIIAL